MWRAAPQSERSKFMKAAAAERKKNEVRAAWRGWAGLAWAGRGAWPLGVT